MKKTSNTGNQAQKVKTDSTGWMIKMLSTILDTMMVNELKPLDLNIKQFAILMTLLEEEGHTQAEIGRKIDMPGFSTTRTLDTLEEKKLIKRCKDEESRRNKRIYLTDSGRKIAPELFRIIKEVNKMFLSTLSTTEIIQLKNLLLKLLKSHKNI